MRIAFLGKGGSGKTTLSAAFALYTHQQGNPTLAIDGDVNMHMAPLLDADRLWLHKFNSDIQRFLEPEIAERASAVIGTLPPTSSSRFISISDNDAFLGKYATRGNNNIPLLTVGTYESKDAGANCYHGKLQILELILHRLADGKDETVVCDMTAGIDALGTSLYMSADLNVFVVEPTLKSVQVFKDFQEAAREHGISTYAIANKIADDEDEAFIRAQIDQSQLLGTVRHSLDLRKVEQGDKSKLQNFVNENAELFAALAKRLKSEERDFDAYLEELKRVYRLNCDWWYNDFYGEDLSQYIDDSFSYASLPTS